MKLIDCLKNCADLFCYKRVVDSQDHEYIFFDDCSVCSTEGLEDCNIQDRTEFEAIQNGVYLLNSVSKSEFLKACHIGKSIAEAICESLKASFPGKEFYVYAHIKVSKYDGIIIRFHQKWPGESPYYENEIDHINEALYIFRV